MRLLLAQPLRPILDARETNPSRRIVLAEVAITAALGIGLYLWIRRDDPTGTQGQTEGFRWWLKPSRDCGWSWGVYTPSGVVSACEPERSDAQAKIEAVILGLRGAP